MKIHRTSSEARLLVFAFSCLLLFGAGCGGSDSTGSKAEAGAVNISLGWVIDDIELEAGKTWRTSFVHDPPVPVLEMPLTNLTIDLEATLEFVTATPVSPGAGKKLLAPKAEGFMTVRVAPVEQQSTVCESGELFGPFTIEIDENMQPESVDPPRATATQSALSIVNTGAFAVCIEILPPLDYKLSVDSFVANPEPCNTPPENMAGVWVGDYSCTNAPCSSGGGTVSLTITQSENGYSGHYEDGEASYDGTICGNVFRYTGGGLDYAESGVFTMTSPTTAVKESEWLYNDASCRGRCRDSLERQ